MKTETIEVPGLPEGWKAVAYRVPMNGENFFYDGKICNDKNQRHEYLIVEKIQPSRMAFDEDALNTAGWAIVEKYNEIVGEGMGGRLFNNLKPLLKIGISEYFRLTEVKETSIPLNNDEPKLSLSVNECRSIIFAPIELYVKLEKFLKENS